MRDEDNEDAPVIEFVNVTSAAASSRFCVSTLQAVGVGAVGADGEAERFADVEHTQPAGLFAVPTTSANTEAVVIRRGDEAVALVVVDKSKPAQNVESGETRLYGVGGSNGTAVIRIRADGSIEIVSKTGMNVTLTAPAAGVVAFQDGSQAFIRGDNFSSALNTAVDAIKTLNTAIGVFATAVGAGTPLFPAVAAAAVVLNTAIGVCNTALDAFKASSSVWLSTKVKGQ